MATQNATLTTAWSKIADADDSALLIQAVADVEWQIATMATEEAPSVQGHVVTGRHECVSRDLIGDGHVYARLGGPGTSITLVVTGSSESLS
jgi:hypothetical protein